jgi:hypothetical protein
MCLLHFVRNIEFDDRDSTRLKPTRRTSVVEEVLAPSVYTRFLDSDSDEDEEVDILELKRQYSEVRDSARFSLT